MPEKKKTLDFLKEIELSETDRLTVDENMNFYLHSQKDGLVKFTYDGIVKQNKEFRKGANCSLAIINGKLACRPSSLRDKIFIYVDMETLEELPLAEQPVVPREARSMMYASDSFGGRFVQDTPLMTDGRYVHILVSVRGQENSSSFNDSSRYIIDIETYDAWDNFRFVKFVRLRNRSGRLYRHNAPDFFNRKWVTNGDVVLWLHRDDTYYFDLETGFKIGKNRRLPCNFDIACYNQTDGLFYKLDLEKEINAFDFATLKKPASSSRETTILDPFIKKRQSEISANVSPQSFKVSSLLEMDEPDQDVAEVDPKVNLEEQFFMLLSSVQNEGSKYFPFAQSDKQGKKLLQHFKFPFGTFLTKKTFMLIDECISLFSSPTSPLDQYSRYFLLGILEAHLLALHRCRIQPEELGLDKKVIMRQL